MVLCWKWKGRYAAVNRHKFSMCNTDWPREWLTDWLTDWPRDWLTDWLTDQVTDWLTKRLTDWLTKRLTDWLTETDWLTKRLTDWITDWPTNLSRLTDWSTNWKTNKLVDSYWHIFIKKEIEYLEAKKDLHNLWQKQKSEWDIHMSLLSSFL